jgi:gliding motility-associated lipoprotein GldH
MRSFLGAAFILVFLLSCDEQRVYEMNTDFDSRYWPVREKPVFEFEISDTVATYNLYANVRNSLDYPYANIFLTWYLQDSAGVQLEKDLVRQLLFDEKTGEPFGESGLGDIYDHRIPLKTDHRFPYAGKYRVAFEHYMRTDTLSGVLAAGLRVEKTSGANQPK